MKYETVADIAEFIGQLPWLAKLYVNVYERTKDKKQAVDACMFTYQIWLKLGANKWQ